MADQLNYPSHPDYKLLSVYRLGDEPENVAVKQLSTGTVIRSEVGSSKGGIEFIGVSRSVDSNDVIRMEGVVVMIEAGLFSIPFKSEREVEDNRVGVLNLDKRKNHIVIGDYEYVYGSVEWIEDERKYVFNDGVFISGGEHYQLYADKIVIYYDKEIDKVRKSTFSQLVTLVNEAADK